MKIIFINLLILMWRFESIQFARIITQANMSNIAQN